MFSFLASFASRRAPLVLSVWLILTAASLYFAVNARHSLKGGGFDATGAEYYLAQKKIASNFDGFESQIAALVKVPPGTRADDPLFQKNVDRVFSELRLDPDVKVIDSWNQIYETFRSAFSGLGDKSPIVLSFLEGLKKAFISKDGAYVLVRIGFRTDEFRVQQRLEELRKKILPGPFEIQLTGVPVFYEALSEVSARDAVKGEFIAIPFVLLVLLTIFRTLTASLLPIAIAGSSILISLALIFFIGRQVDLSIFVLNIGSLLGIGLGIDYALLMVSRFREELHRQGDVDLALVTTLGTAGQAVFYSGLTVMVGLSSLFAFPFMIQRSMGLAGILVVSLALLGSLTFLPAILKLLGNRVNALKLPFVPLPKFSDAAASSVWKKIAGLVMRFPILSLIVVLGVLFFLGSPMLHYRFGTSNHEILPADQPARQATEILQTRFEGFYKTSDLLLVAEPREGTVVNEKEWSDFRVAIARKPHVLSTELQESSGVRLLRVGTDFKYGSAESGALIDEIRASGPKSFSLLVGGENARLKDFVKALYSHFPEALAVVLILSYLVLLAMFRSVILPAKAILLTGLSLTASYGALVWLFQDGHLSGLLGFSRQGYLEAVLPILIFSILFGLSMDYEVFLLSRIRELYDENGDNEKSVVEGLGYTSGIITSAALILILVSLGFAMADIVPVKAIGIGMAVAVAVDATLVRAILLPSAMKLLGKWNWWWPFQKK